MEMNYDENALRQLEQELHTQIVPGTEIMTDVGSHHFVKSSATSDQVLVPQPSNDIHDPLNWSTFWKFSTLTSVTAATFVQGMGPLSLAPMFPELIKAFHSNLADVVQFTGIAILVLGFSNFIWYRATIQPNVITDVMFLHERGTYQTVYFLFYFGSLAAGPIIAGSMAQYAGVGDKGWRNFWWLNVGLIGLTFLMLLFGFPETKWHRSHPNEIHRIENEKQVPSSAEKSDGETKESCKKVEKTSTDSQEYTPADIGDPYLRKGRPSKQQFKLYQPNANPWKSIALDLWIPWKLFAFPIVEFASFIVSWSASCFLTVNLTQSQAFSAPPYEFKPLVIGFFNFAILVGLTIGLITAGPLSDWISMKLTKRNNGVREPEMRLPTMIPYFFLMLLGNFLTAFGWKEGWSWRVIVILGWTCTGIQVAALPSIASTYAVDSYKPVAGSIFVSITVNKNLWGYGFSKFIIEWVEEQGYVPPIMTNMCLTTLWCLSAFIFWFYGKKFRVWSRNSNVHRM